MQAIVGVYWDIALMRRGARDVPASLGLLALSGLAYFLVSLVAARLVLGERLALRGALVDVAVTVGLFGGALVVRRRSHRIPQALSAIFGTGAIIGCFTLGLVYLQVRSAEGSAAGYLLSLAQAPFLLWIAVICSGIARSALDIERGTAMALALTYLVVDIVATGQLPRALG